MSFRYISNNVERVKMVRDTAAVMVIMGPSMFLRSAALVTHVDPRSVIFSVVNPANCVAIVRTACRVEVVVKSVV